MADYIGAFRSSYFRVEDENTYESLKCYLAGDDAEFWDKERDGEIYHCFGGYIDLSNCIEDAICEDGESDKEPNHGRFMEELSKIIKEGDACVIMSAGHDKLDYIAGDVAVITKDHVEIDSLVNRAEEIMRDHGVDPSYVAMHH